MSSKLYEPDERSDAEPIRWRNAQGGPPVAARRNEQGLSRTDDPGGAAQVLLTQQQKIHDLERDLDQRTRDSYQQGYAAGQSAGAEQASRELDPVLARIARSIEDLTGLRGKIRAEVEEDAVRLSVAVARKILHREIAVDADALLGLVKAAFQRVDTRELHRIRVHPADVPGLDRHLKADGMPARLELMPDPSLERGAVIFETARGDLDASIGTQLQEIERGFIDVVRRSRNAV
jgi:flagellar assembly protein FliH